MPLPSRPGRPWLCAWLCSAVALLTACATPLPAVQWLRLQANPPDAAQVSRVVSGPVQLMGAVALPGHLDRDPLLVPQGLSGLQPLGTARWAEPLRDAVPRLLHADLALRLGAPVWAAPLPPGLVPAVQLRVDLQALDVVPDLRHVRLQARWTLADPQGRRAPQVFEARFDTPAAAVSDADALARAHRAALWELSARIAASLAAAR